MGEGDVVSLQKRMLENRLTDLKNEIENKSYRAKYHSAEIKREYLDDWAEKLNYIIQNFT